MKLLVLHQKRGKPVYEHLHQNWFKRLAELEDVVFYGPKVTEYYGLEKCTRFSDSRSIKEIVRGFEIDVVIIYTKDRMFYDYRPKSLYPGSNNSQWLNGTIKDVGVPVVCIEDDYHYELDDSWHKENGIDLILQRHYSQVLRQEKVDQDWLPFSIDPEIFYLGNEKRFNKVCFLGSLTNKDAYCFRIGACKLLEEKGYIDVFRQYQKEGYPQILRSFLCCLSGASKYKICAGKNFEIMACGSILLTNNFPGLDKLFPEDSYITYREDFSDLIEKVEWLLSDPDSAQQMRQSASDCIRWKHTYDCRVRDLMIILRKRYE